MTTYTYVLADFTSAVEVDISDLQSIILASSISSATIQYINVTGTTYDLVFSGALSGPDQTTLDGIVASYVYDTVPETVVSNTSTDTLANKTLLTDTNYFADATDDTKKIGFACSGSSTGITTTFAAVSTSNRTLTFPDITDTVVTLTASQTLSNKTFSQLSLSGTGSTTASSAVLYSNPSSTAFTGSNTYFFNYFNTPPTSGSTTGSASTVYIAGAPANATTSYALQVAGGISTFAGAVDISAASNQLILGSTNRLTLTTGALAASRTYTFPDAGGAASFILSTSGAGQTIAGGLTSSGTLTASNGFTLTTGALNITSTSGSISLTGTTFSSNSTLSLTGTTAATSVSAANLTNAGGIGISKNLWVGSSFSNTVNGLNGAVINVPSLTFTDSSTAASGTATTNNIVSVVQPTIAATNASVTTTRASTAYFGGAPILGTNETFTNCYGVYIDAAATTGATVTEASSLLIANAPTVVSGTTYAVKVNSGKTYLGGAVQIPTGAVNKYSLTSDGSGNATWGLPYIPYFEAIANGSISTTSGTLINITGMTLTPTIAGTYQVTFTTNFRVSNANRIATFDVALNGTTVTNSTNAITVKTANQDVPITIIVLVTVNGTSDTITARYARSANTLTLEDYRRLGAIRLDS